MSTSQGAVSVGAFNLGETVMPKPSVIYIIQQNNTLYHLKHYTTTHLSQTAVIKRIKLLSTRCVWSRHA